jgi:hypothetical protein
VGTHPILSESLRQAKLFNDLVFWRINCGIERAPATEPQGILLVVCGWNWLHRSDLILRIVDRRFCDNSGPHFLKLSISLLGGVESMQMTLLTAAHTFRKTSVFFQTCNRNTNQFNYQLMLRVETSTSMIWTK